LIAFGHASTDKWQVIKDALKTILNTRNGNNKAFLSTFEIRDEKIFDLCAPTSKESTSSKVRDVLEGKDGFFNVADLFRVELDPADIPAKAEKTI
jgi:hypothetical protein